MATVSTDLTLIQARLHDSGTIWTRAELLRWYNDGYRQFVAQSQAFARILPLDIPGRHSYGIAHGWEVSHTNQGTYWFPMYPTYGASRSVSYRWEVEHLEGLTPSASHNCLTYQWERAYTTESDRHFQFALPTQHDRLKRLEWNNHVLLPVAVREFDETDDDWMRRSGEPTWWTSGLGPIRSVEVYEIDTTYQQGYALLDWQRGMPRLVAGDRTYQVDGTSFSAGHTLAYSTQGDGQALAPVNMPFAPATGYTNDSWESSYGTSPRWNFTINLSMNFPAITATCMHPWELDYIGGTALDSDASSPGKRGIFAWEHHDIDGAYAALVPLPDEKPTFTGYALRFTKVAADSSSSFCTQTWETEVLEGETTFTAGETIGSTWWEFWHGATQSTAGLGTVRDVRSADRQYLPQLSEAAPLALAGIVRDWRSSEDTLMAWELIVPPVDLAETDSPVLIPEPMQKYLRFYVLAKAFGREGEGQRPDMAQHYDQRFQRGVFLMKRLADASQQDRVWRRESSARDVSRIPLVRLPSTFERVL